MTKRMLIDATHDEETRVAVVDDGDNRLLEFDYESKFRKPLKGSIFLAKVTRVEPSLQAAFVNFGGNRHGFLPFSEIHPDYFRIPIADREALMAEQDALLAEEEERQRLEEEAEEAGNSSDETVDDADAENADDAMADAENEISDESDDDEIEDITELNSDDDLDEDDVSDDENEAPALEADDEETEPAQSEKIAKQDNSDSDNEKADNENAEDATNSNADESAENSEQSGDIDSADAENANNDSGNEENDEAGDGNKKFRRGRGRGRGRGRRGGRGRGGNRHRRAAYDSRKVEILGGTEYDEDGQNSASERFRFSLRRKYKIQEVIKRGQIMLVQVSREERGNKGAAVSTYLSLPGRYGVLMPNSPRAGGVSRKISNYQDRQRMRETLREMDIPKGMSVILRTAGVTRTKTEIKRDIDYLMKLWNDIREHTLQSSAPAKIYEEADLIKKSIRDLYTRDIEDIQIAGDDGYKNAKKIMKMLIPSHAKKVKQYKESIPLFHKHRVESQIAEMNDTTARLKSGGYLVINPTEALVSIDVNSGRATKERHIEETALNTNMEAAEEVARQLRLRDLGGLVVIDFIDMEDRRNNAKVERKLKESLSNDRARIQIGRISSFGLLELSRQRLNPSLTEAQFDVCPHCEGRGVIRNNDSTSILLLRALEEVGIKGKSAQIAIHVSQQIALYIMNNKREHLQEIEMRYNFSVLIRVDNDMAADAFRIETIKPADGYNQADSEGDSEDSEDEENNKKGGRNKRRRGGRGRGRNNRDQDQNADENLDSDAENSASPSNEDDSEKDEKPKRKRSRSRSKKKDENDVSSEPVEEAQNAEAPQDEEKLEEKPKKKQTRSRSKKKSEEHSESVDEAPAEAIETSEKEESEKKPAAKKRGRPTKKKDTESAENAKAEENAEESQSIKIVEASNDVETPEANHAAEHETVNEPPKKKKKGWWNKLVE